MEEAIEQGGHRGGVAQESAPVSTGRLEVRRREARS